LTKVFLGLISTGLFLNLLCMFESRDQDENLGVGKPEGIDCIVGETYFTGHSPSADLSNRKRKKLIGALDDSPITAHTSRIRAMYETE